MILKASEKDTAEIREIWKICFPSEDPRYIDFYFKNKYKPEDCFVNVEDGKIVSVLCRNKHAIMFNGKVLQASMLVGVATLPEYRNKGYMHDLLEVVLDACAHSELLTLIRTEKPELYEPYGFRKEYFRSEFMVQKKDLKRIGTFGCGYEVKPLDMLIVYSEYMHRFDGFYARNLGYFVDYRKEVAAMGGKTIGYYNSKDKIDGYATYTVEGSDLYIDEIVYLSFNALTKILNFCLQERPRVHFNVSKDEAEGLKLLFPEATVKDYPASTMVRLNDENLFNKLFNTRVHGVNEAMRVCQLSLNQNESA